MIQAPTAWLAKLAAQQKQAIYLVSFPALGISLSSHADPCGTNVGPCPPPQKFAIIRPTQIETWGDPGIGTAVGVADGIHATATIKRYHSSGLSNFDQIRPGVIFSKFKYPAGVSAGQLTKITTLVRFTHIRGLTVAGYCYWAWRIPTLAGVGPDYDDTSAVSNLASMTDLSPAIGHTDPTVFDLPGSSFYSVVNSSVGGDNNPPDEIDILDVAFLVCYTP